ncbi:unnamed protein product [Thelazia callipaeda]|uniref:SP-RING-type domain-containing protein n=1 Tax=Thelazia callipaeda TaxID=103827 RepID=A0A0N5D4M7_THECL|nr:unnamed protein product [Thelazia callipaeda]
MSTSWKENKSWIGLKLVFIIGKRGKYLKLIFTLFAPVALQQFRVNELHILLSSFKCPKLGKKTELVQRCINLLHNSRNQAAVIQKIREISSSRRYNVPSAPSVAMYNHSENNNIVNSYESALNMPPVLMKQHYNPVHCPFSSQMNRASILRVSELPFYDKQQTLLELSELPANISGLRSIACMYFSFAIPHNVIPLIAHRRDCLVLPRTELQLRFFLLDHSAEQEDDFPPNCGVKIDDIPVTLPNVIPTNKPNAEAKRPSRPVDITSYCQPPRDISKAFRLEVEWTADRRAWAVGVYVVERLTSDIFQRFLANASTYRDAEETKRTIIDRLSCDDDGIQMESLRMSLLCPLGKTRMLEPVKAYDCSHLQCFDLLNFLKMNEKRPTWKCPVCNNIASFKKLIVDGYFKKILKDTSVNVTEIELLSDGTWRSVDVDQYVSDDEEVSIPNSSKSRLKDAGNHGLSSGNRGEAVPAEDIITLDSDDSDEVTERPSIQDIDTSRRRNTSSSVVCIDLDDSDPSEIPSRTCHALSISPVPAQLCNNIPVNASTSSTPSNVSAEDCTQMHSARPLMQQYFQHQRQPSSLPNHSMPYYPNQAMPLIPPSNSVMSGSNSANYFNPFDQPYNFYQQDYNTRLIAEELRQFMANIQHSSNSSSFPKNNS